jgi:hypothetical protein
MTQNKPLMSIGWLLAAEEADPHRLRAYQQAATDLCALLQAQFPHFHWEMPFVVERRYSPYGALSPLPLLELGVHEKLSRHWDFALVLVPNDLIPHSRIFTLGVPSSALEVAVLSAARIRRAQEATTSAEMYAATATGESAFIEGLIALALHLLGHVWGIEHAIAGPMVPPEDCHGLCPTDFTDEQQQAIVDRLEEVADARLEEQPRRWRRVPFYWRTFWADPKGIWTDVIGYKPWRLPFRMGRLTAAAAVSIVFLLLTEEAWVVGTNQSVGNLMAGGVVAVVGATLFLFWGQNLGEVARSSSWREQIIRTRMVVFLTLWIGMIALWVVLFGISLLTALYVPTNVPLGWLGLNPQSGVSFTLLVHQGAFMAILGVVIGALGGNLEDEDALKAQLFYDEEM